MARPLSEDKRTAILDAATEVVARLGVSAQTAKIADTTMDFIAREPAQAKRYTKAGFDAFWRAVAG
jgi:hypothetical protein